MLSYKNIWSLPIVACLLFSCKREASVAPSLNSFSVTADSSATPGDTAYYYQGSKTNFAFNGNPNTITFYSGELGHRYMYRSRTSAAGAARLIFTNVLNSGSQPNSLQLMVSHDFKGVVKKYAVVGGVTVSTAMVTDSAATQANFAAATWTDMTPTLATGTTPVIDTVDLTGHATAGKPVYIAFKYTAQPGSVQNKWTISNLKVINTLPDSSVYTIANLNAPIAASPITNYGANTYSPGWVGYTVANTYNWAITPGTSLVITGASTAAAATDKAEAWTFMGTLDLTKVTPDMGVALKDMTTAPSPYKYLYLARGKYDAFFAASNFTAYAQDTITRKIPVVIK